MVGSHKRNSNGIDNRLRTESMVLDTKCPVGSYDFAENMPFVAMK